MILKTSLKIVSLKNSIAKQCLQMSTQLAQNNTARKWRFTEIKSGLNLLKAGHPTLRHQLKVLKGG